MKTFLVTIECDACGCEHAEAMHADTKAEAREEGCYWATCHPCNAEARANGDAQPTRVRVVAA